MTLKLPSPAKINWFLHIVGQRPDGYHELETCFQFLDLCDELTFNKTSSTSISIIGMNHVALQDNLIYKAALALKPFAPAQGIDISINKRIPLGGGLGGGSSNAATTLFALNQLWDLNLTQTQLLELALPLGADVPVFIHGRGCFAQGIGEKLNSIDMPSRWLLLVIPDCQVSTKKLFMHPQLTRTTPRCKMDTLKALDSINLRPRGFKNDFEPLVRKLYTPVARAMNWLEGLGSANLTGTGSCVFAPFANEQEARTAASQLPSTMRGLVVKTLNRSPLCSAADN